MTTRRKKPKVVETVQTTQRRVLRMVVNVLDSCDYNTLITLRMHEKTGLTTLMEVRERAIAALVPREIPRKKKPAVARAADAASRVWWADVDRAAKSARVLRDKTKRKRKRAEDE